MSRPFLWGAATSAHQVEGNNIHSDWWAWEKRTAGVARSGVACDHYHRFPEDFALAKSLGHNAHRLSLEWSRIEIRRGQINQAALDHYREVLMELKRLGLVSTVTLHHFTNPQWFAARGGWLSPGAVAQFTAYVATVVQSLGDLVDVWLTINEPVVYATQSYWHRNWPPERHSLAGTYRVLRYLAAAHIAAYHTIHKAYPDAVVGVPHSVIAYQPARPEVWGDRAAANFWDWWYNHHFLSITARTHDFLGVNYYLMVEKQTRLTPPFVVDRPYTGARSDLNWPIRPEGLTALLLALRRYNLPIYITENGLADMADSKRADFIRAHVRAIEAAQQQGARVQGYFHWSLLDNFEWREGFTPRFGLVAVDFTTQQRTPRPSAYVYKAIIAQSAGN